MGRSQILALVVVTLLGGSLLLVRYGPSTTTESAAPAGGIINASSAEPDTSVVDSEPTDDSTESATLEEAPPVIRPAESFEDLDGWLQTDNDSLEDFDDQVRIVQFWTYSCHNCTATIPFLQEIYAEHQPDGLEIIGVHTPEFEFEKDPAGIAAAAEDLGVTWPIALDTDKTNFRIWQKERRFWPRTYIVDQVGNIRYDHIGEGNYEELNDTVAYLIENGA